MKNLPYIVILALIIVLVVQHLMTPKPLDETEYIKIGSKEYILLKNKVDTIWEVRDSLIPVYRPVPGPRVEVEVPANVDTTAILKDYFSKNVYNDTIRLDSVGYVSVKDTISENFIYSREVYYNYEIPTITKTTIVKDKPVNQVYAGFGANINSSLYVGGLLKNKQDRIYGLNLGLSVNHTQVTPFIGGSIYWKLKLKK